MAIYVLAAWAPGKPGTVHPEYTKWFDNFDWQMGETCMVLCDAATTRRYMAGRKIRAGDAIVALDCWRNNPENRAMADAIYAATDEMPKVYNSNWRAKKVEMVFQVAKQAKIVPGDLLTYDANGIVRKAERGELPIGIAGDDGKVMLGGFVSGQIDAVREALDAATMQSLAEAVEQLAEAKLMSDPRFAPVGAAKTRKIREDAPEVENVPERSVRKARKFREG